MIEANHWSNLLWSIGTPSIVHGSGLPWLPPERRDALTAFFSLEPVRTQLQPALEALIEGRHSWRLGAYFEDLWTFAFSRHPDYELLYHNLTLHDGIRTLGELDFVVQYLPTGNTEHWELAVKFYLQVADEHWVGPGLRDRLDRKLARMREHQLPLIRQPMAREILHQRNIDIDRQWVLMPGRLFRPLGEHLAPPPPGLDAAGCRFWWAELAEFQHTFSQHDYRWATLPKRAWLADTGYAVLQSHNRESLCAHIGDSGLPGPACVAGMLGTKEQTRGFIVPDGWYESALDSL